MLFKGTKILGTTDYAAEKPLLDEIETTARELITEKAKGEKGDPAKVRKLGEKLAALEKDAAKYVIKRLTELYSRNGGTGYNAFTSKMAQPT
jgi:hypothetical protein